MKKRKGLSLALIFLCVTILATVTSTYAWFTVAGYVRLHQMEIYITGGPILRIDTVSHQSDFDAYVKSVDQNAIAAQIKERLNLDLSEIELDPVTSGNGKRFYTRLGNTDGTTVDATEGKFVEFTLYLISDKDMWVHLTSANTSAKMEDGTAVEPLSKGIQSHIVGCTRISFEADGDVSLIYEPDSRNPVTLTGLAAQDTVRKTVTLPDSDQMVYTDETRICHLTAGTEKEVTVRIWLEGQDPDCNNWILEAEMSVRLALIGTEDDNTPVVTY